VGHTLDTDSDIDTIFQTFGVDIYGYDMLDRKLLHILGDTYSGRAVGLSTLAQMIGEEVHTIEDVVEPYLLQSGMIERTARGRIITPK
jgi:Holliday junction DNA helicase RuvB